jgi:hypothetical protein
MARCNIRIWEGWLNYLALFVGISALEARHDRPLDDIYMKYLGYSAGEQRTFAVRLRTAPNQRLV